jgi:hypothetical protein
MKKTLFNLLSLAAAVSLSACSIREGRIAMPPHLSTSTERLDLRGMGGGTRGNFNLAGAYGRFTRSAERLAIFDPLFVRNSGGGSFRLEHSQLGPDLSGRCRYREREVNAGPISVIPRRMVYHCDFAREGRPIDAELILEDPKGALGTVHGRAERDGMLVFEGLRIGIRSIHRDQRGGLPAPTALGYLFDIDGYEMGAVDLNGINKTIYAPRSPLEREAVLAASLALSVFWDPAVVQP